MKFLLGLFTVLFFSLSPIKDNEACSALIKNNQFTYWHGSNKVLVVFKDGYQTEYHKKKKYIIRSKVKWISECEYELTIIEHTLPDFPFNPGTKSRVVITKIRGNRIYYTTTLAGRSWEGRFKKVKS